MVVRTGPHHRQDACWAIAPPMEGPMAEAKLYVLQSICELRPECIKTTLHPRAGQGLKEPSIFEGNEVRDDYCDQNLYRARADPLDS